MTKRFVLSAVLGLAAVFIATNVSQVQSYFYGYYYPEENRFHSYQQVFEGNYDSYGMPGYAPYFQTRPVYRQPVQPVQPASPATIRMVVPDAQAKVWFQDHGTKSTGTSRLFVTPPIASGEVIATM